MTQCFQTMTQKQTTHSVFRPVSPESISSEQVSTTSTHEPPASVASRLKSALKPTREPTLVDEPIAWDSRLSRDVDNLIPDYLKPEKPGFMSKIKSFFSADLTSQRRSRSASRSSKERFSFNVSLEDEDEERGRHFRSKSKHRSRSQSLGKFLSSFRL